MRLVPLTAAALLVACHDPTPAPAATRPLVLAEAPRLPEDPAAAKASTAQWDEHLQHEEDERQTLFDRQRLPQHNALLGQLRDARDAYIAASDTRALAGVRIEMPQRIARFERDLKDLDPWGNNSRLLADYRALETLLSERYAEAKVDAFKGDQRPLKQLEADFDTRLKTMSAWLERVEEDEGEEEED